METAGGITPSAASPCGSDARSAAQSTAQKKAVRTFSFCSSGEASLVRLKQKPQTVSSNEVMVQPRLSAREA